LARNRCFKRAQKTESWFVKIRTKAGDRSVGLWGHRPRREEIPLKEIDMKI
jgi:hypothetical protein